MNSLIDWIFIDNSYNDNKNNKIKNDSSITIGSDSYKNKNKKKIKKINFIKQIQKINNSKTLLPNEKLILINTITNR